MAKDECTCYEDGEECDCCTGEENRVFERTDNRFDKERWACTALEECRAILDARQKYNRAAPGDGTLAILIEEMQTMFNHMEAALQYRKSIREWEEEARQIAAKVDAMQDEAYKMGLELDRNKHNALRLEED